MSKPLPNARHERFAQLVASGKSAAAAYVDAGYLPSTAASSRLSAKVSVRARIEQLKAGAAKRTEISLAGVTERLIRIADAAEKLADAPGLSVARAAAMDAAKLNGLVVNRIAASHSFDLSGLTDDELEQLERLRSKVAPAGGDPGGASEAGG
ncbi:terminase small subunit [Sandarakinorhabdus sp. DWP1-3-1]|uniref:terminase small subunit n=1 Tax=Sandarakinorhabdus sp. DWP1-3-1 TaxID=2804627 RepID=UPI003CEBBC7F